MTALAPVLHLDTERRDRYRRVLAAAHAAPSGFARLASRGRWIPARHHLAMDKAARRAIATGGRVIISVAVRSGKTELLARWLPAWFLGRHPDKRVILGSHDADFAASHGRFARDVLSEWGSRVFGVRVSDSSAAAGRWDLAAPHRGGMLTVGVGGSPIGRGADLMVIDDPIRNFEAAMSARERQRVREWWAGTLRTRLEPGAAVIVIASRWHEEDLSGWLLENFPDEWEELRLPALAEPGDPLGREPGEALWPERGWTVEEYERTKREVTADFGEIVWLAQYQQRPAKLGGGMFPLDKWEHCDPHEVPGDVDWWRAWDLAATGTPGADWTVGVKIGRSRTSGRWYVADVVRGQWEPDDVDATILRVAHEDGRGVPIWLPQDPGQAGKAQANALRKLLAGFRPHIETVSGSKETRAWPLAAQQRGGNVTLVRASWNPAFREEFRTFPTGRNDDQVDAAASGMNAALGLATERRGGLRYTA